MNSRRTVVYFTALIVSLMFVWFTGPARPSWAQEPGPSLGLEVSPEALTPTRLSYQGRITNPSTGDPVSGTYTIIFRIYDDPAAGNKLWEEGKDIQVSAGLFNSPLGDTTPLDPAMFNGQSLWLALKVGADPEAIPRQQVLPVAYALSLLPGATVSTTAASPALTLRNAGSGDALRVEGRLFVTGDLAVGGNLVGGAHSHDDAYVNSIGPDTMSGKETVPILSLTQSGTGYGGYFTSIDGTGFRGDTRADLNETAGVMGIAGTVSTALNNYAGVMGKSRYGYGVAGIGDASVGVWGQSAFSYGVYGWGSSSLAGVYGTNTGSGAGVYGRSVSGSAGVYGINTSGGAGVQGYSSNYWGGYFSSGTAGALYAGGPSTVAGTLTTQKVAYSSPRTHYWSVSGEAFQPTSSSSVYTNYGGAGGACVSTGANLVAPVHLPDGAVVTALTGNYYVNGGPTVTVYLYRLYIGTASENYANLASVSSSGISGRGSATTSSISNATIDNANYGYFINAWWGTGNCNTEVRGVVVRYTLSEAE